MSTSAASTATSGASSGAASASASAPNTTRRTTAARSQATGTTTLAPPAVPKKRERAADSFAANDSAEARSHEASALSSLPTWASLAALEGELERTLKRRRLQCQECLPRAHGQNNCEMRRFKLVLGADVVGLSAAYRLGAGSDAQETRVRPHVHLRLSAHVLDKEDKNSAVVGPVRASSLLRAVTLILVDSQGRVARVGEWRRSESAAEVDAFELSHAFGDAEGKGEDKGEGRGEGRGEGKGEGEALTAHALLELDTFPARYAPSAAFAHAMRYTAASITKVSAVLKVWEYCKAQRLIDGAEHIAADATLTALFGVAHFRYADVPRLLRAHLLPLAPLHLALPLRPGHHELWAEAAVDVPIPHAPFDAHRNLDALRGCDKRVREALAEIEEHRARRSVLAQFAEAPVAFLEDAALHQTRALKQSALPDAQHGRDAEDERAATTYYQGRTELTAAIGGYLSSRT